MGSIWKSFFSVRQSLAALALVVAISAQTFAADTVALVSLKPTGKLFSDIEYLMEATGTGALGQIFMPQVKAFLQGIDETKPIGVAVMVDSGNFKPLAFVPVTDLSTLLGNLEQQMGPASDAGDGVTELDGPQPVFIKEQEGWAFVGQTVQALEELPENPAQLFEGLDQSYDISVRAYLKNLPEFIKQLIVGQMTALAQNSMQDDSGAAQAQIQQLQQTINESDTVTLGWQIDPVKRQTYFDMVSKPIAGTQMAKQVGTSIGVESDFAGFVVEDAAIRGNITNMFLPEQIEQTLAGLAQAEASTLKEIDEDEDLDDGTRSAAKKLINTFFSIAGATIKTGKIDICQSVILKPKSIMVLMAAHVADGSQVEAAVKQLIAASKSQTEISFSSVEFNVAEHADVSFHKLAVSVPEDKDIRDVFGETLEITLGTAPESVYLAIGTDGMEHLIRQIDASASASGQSVDPLHAEFKLTPMLEFAESMAPNPVLRSLTQMVSDQPDHLRMRVTADEENGVMYRLTLEEGILSVLGQAVQMFGVNGGGGF